MDPVDEDVDMVDGTDEPFKKESSVERSKDAKTELLSPKGKGLASIGPKRNELELIS